MYRQALYACATCSGVDSGDGQQQSQSEPGGVCLACSLHCHDGHTLYELYTKRWVLPIQHCPQLIGVRVDTFSKYKIID